MAEGDVLQIVVFSVLFAGLTAPEPPAKPQSFGDIIAHLSPFSIIKAIAEGDVLQIVVCTVLFAGLIAPEPPAKPQRFGDIIAHSSQTLLNKSNAA